MQGMDNGDDAPSPAVRHWTVGLTCVAIAATAYLIVGLLFEREPELTTAPPTPTTTTSEPPDPAEYSYVTPPVPFPVQIPGCDVVEPPQPEQFFSVVEMGTTEYDNPSYPWFSGPKAFAMTQALRAALPADAEIAFAPVDRSLVFQPILGDAADDERFGGWTDARAALLRGDRSGSLSVTVRRSALPIPPCVAGHLDERRRLPDGTTLDTREAWYETNGVRTLERSATAYLPDGSVANAYATDEAAGATGPTGAVPLTVDDLVAVVTTPELRVTAPVPPETPNPPERCDIWAEPSPAIDRAQARRWDAVLARIPLDGATLDRPLGALLPGSEGGVCQAVRVTTPGRESRLSVSISIGQPLPPEDGGTARRLPDGAVLETAVFQSSGTGWSTHANHTVTVTRPSGIRIQVTSGDGPAEPLPYELLEAIASDPGLEVSR